MEEIKANCTVCLDDKAFIECYACSDYDYEEEDNKSYLSVPLDNNSYSYFGRMSDEQPDIGVIYSMLDEHIQKIIDKRGESFHKSLHKSLKEFKHSIKEDLEKNRKSVCFQRADMKLLQKKSIEQEKEIKSLRLQMVKLMSKSYSNENDVQEMADIKASLTKKGIIKDKK